MAEGEDVFPDRDMSHRDKVLFMLEREGWAMDNVPTQADPPFPRYSYTIGIEDRFGFPELCILGLSPVACRGLFDLVVGELAAGTDLPVGPPFIGLLDGGQPCAFLALDSASLGPMFPSLGEHLAATGADPTSRHVVQLLWPDHHGKLPWDEAFDPKLAPAQVLLA
jgi:hypothetical protein